MRLDAPLQARLLLFIEQCELLYGQTLRLSEALSTNGLNFDRHFTTHCELAFTLTTSLWRFSGGRLLLTGAASSYEIGTDHLVAFQQLGPSEYEFMERYGPTVFRRTTLQILPAPAPHGL